jgi:hypothetical protein
MRYDGLGEVKETDCEPFDGVAMVRYGSREIRVGISRDDQTFGTTLKLAAHVVTRLPELDAMAKNVAVTGLREIYNSGWNEYDEARDDGSLKPVSNPKLSEAEFESKLSLIAINVGGDRIVDFFYDDENMFWGHSVVVCSLNGTDFTDARAELMG